MNLLGDRVIHFESLFNMKSLTFEKYLKILFSGNFDVDSLKYYKGERTSIYIAGDSLRILYEGFLEKKADLPESLVIYRGYDQSGYNKDKSIVFSNQYNFRDIKVHNFSANRDKLKSLAHSFNLNCMQLSYNINTGEFYESLEFFQYRVTKQVSISLDDNTNVDRALVDLLKAKIQYLKTQSEIDINISQEVNRLAYNASCKDKNNCSLMRMIYSSKRRTANLNKLIIEINDKFDLYKIKEIISQDSRVLDFIVKAGLQKLETMVQRVNNLLDYPRLFHTLVKRSGYDVNDFISVNRKIISKEKMRFVEDHIGRLEVANYFLCSRIPTDILVDDLYVFRKQVRSSKGIFCCLLSKYKRYYGNLRLSPELMAQVLRQEIKNGYFKNNTKLDRPVSLNEHRSNKDIENVAPIINKIA